MKTVNAADYAETIIKAIPKGCLVTTKAGEKVNSMVIGWGTYGVECPSSNPMANKDPHIAYYGEIVNAYIAE